MGPIAPIPPTPPLEQIVQNQALTAGFLQATGQAPAAQAAGTSPLASFQDFFANAIHDSGRLEEKADHGERNLLVDGAGLANLHGTFIALEKADLAFQLTMAIRDKVISAYQSVMQMSV